jgi:hypothetical protein
VISKERRHTICCVYCERSFLIEPVRYLVMSPISGVIHPLRRTFGQDGWRQQHLQSRPTQTAAAGQMVSFQCEEVPARTEIPPVLPTGCNKSAPVFMVPTTLEEWRKFRAWKLRLMGSLAIMTVGLFRFTIYVMAVFCNRFKCLERYRSNIC